MILTSQQGGVAGRRAIVRWAWRLYRREWRQQALVLGLLVVAVALAVGVALAAYNIAPVSGNAEFGTADTAFGLVAPAPDVFAADVAATAAHFGAVDVVAHWDVAVPGSQTPLDYRSQDPDGTFSAPMLALVSGRYPISPDQVALTDDVAATFDVGVGDMFALDGVSRRVVGIVENPSALGDEFALLAPDASARPDTVSLLAKTDGARFGGFQLPGQTALLVKARDSGSEDVLAAVAVFVASSLALFLVALVTASSFIVVAQRRQRQLGMLSALGATPKHLRLVMISTGAAIGGVAAVLGAVLGMAGWVAVVPRIERAAGYRIDQYNIPWWLVAVGMALSVATAVGAAWWPARQAARVPIMTALSGRPPRPVPSRRSAGVAVAFLVAGIGCLLLAGDVGDGSSDGLKNLLLIAGGTIGTIVGVLLVSPLAVGALARCASRFPIAVRLPLRDLGRFQARSGAALAAISLALGVPVAVIATAAGAENGASSGNLAADQLLIAGADLNGPFAPTDDQVGTLQNGVEAITATLDDPTVTPIQAIIDPAADQNVTVEGRDVINVARADADGFEFVSMLVVASPALLAHYDVDLATLPDSTAFLTAATGDLTVAGPPSPDRQFHPEDITDPVVLRQGYTSIPSSFVTIAELERRGWQTVSAGRWLIDLAAPLTDAQLSAARQVAGNWGLTIEDRDDQAGLWQLRAGATGVGIALALSILAMTVGLIRGEAIGDLRTLTATGASSGTRRTLTATTAGGLALLGALLGIAGAYAALAAGPFGDLDRLRHVPVAQLAMIGLGTPVLAAAIGWLVLGREPTIVTRQPVA